MEEEKVIEAEAEVIEPPAALAEADRWLAEQRAKVEARAGDFSARRIESAEDYRQSKRERAALRRLISEVDGDRKRMTAAIDDALRGFRDATKGLLSGLADEEAAYKREISAWESRVVQERTAALAARYADEWPDLAEQVPYGLLSERFGAGWKADNYGTSEAAIWKGVEEAAGTVAGEVSTLETMSHVDGVELTEDDRRDLMADYLRGLDYAGAQRACVERVRRREAVRRAEEGRRAWEAEQRAREAVEAMDAAERAREGAPEPACAPEAPAPAQTPARAASGPQEAHQGPEAVYVYEVRVPESVMPRFLVEMKRIGTHGSLIRKE